MPVQFTLNQKPVALDAPPILNINRVEDIGV